LNINCGYYCYFILFKLVISDRDVTIFSIDKLKNELGKSFAMKDMGATKRILDISISCDRREKNITL